MGRTKNKPTSLPAPTRLAELAQREVALGIRIAKALVHARLERQQLAEAADVSPRRLDLWIRGQTSPANYELLAIAERCGVDPRWLATGKMSPAAAAAVQFIASRKMADFGKSEEAFSAVNIIRTQLELLQQPMNGPFYRVCRYCLCTTDFACDGGCEWVDDDQTICSACLDPERVNDE